MTVGAIDLGLVEAIDGFGQGVVITVADTADRGYQPGFRQALRVIHGQVLNAAMAVMDQPIFRAGPSGVDRLSRASRTKLAVGAVLTFQPTIRRAYASITKATYTKPAQVWSGVGSA